MLSAGALAASFAPPVNPPTWWTSAPNNVTRLQYHSFATDPNLGLSPDYTMDGFDPGFLPNPPYPVNTQDWWTFGNTTFSAGTSPASAQYGDGASASVDAGTTLTKAMGNEPQAFVDKTYFYEVVWTTKLFYGGGSLPINFPQLSVTGFGAAPTYTVTGDGGGLAGSSRIDTTQWYVSYWTGTISPQPDYETFSIFFPEASYVDSVWVGTICPEPASMVGVGCFTALALLLRRQS